MGRFRKWKERIATEEERIDVGMRIAYSGIMSMICAVYNPTIKVMNALGGLYIEIIKVYGKEIADKVMKAILESLTKTEDVKK